MRQEVSSTNVVLATVAALCLLLPTWPVVAQQITPLNAPLPPAKLDLQQVLANLEQRNLQRAAALKQFEGTRVYRMEYHGFPSDRDAQMVVKVTFRSPNSKQFTIVSETGSKFVIDHVFKKLLESEQEFLTPDHQQEDVLTRKNYNFEMAGYQTTPDGPQYVLSLVPKNKDKYSYHGKIWVDAHDFAVTRMEGEPARNPSVWIRKTEIAHSYKKVDGFWLPAENHTESFIRLGGRASLSIQYQDYKITKASPAEIAKKLRQSGDAAVDGSVTGDGSWAQQFARRIAP